MVLSSPNHAGWGHQGTFLWTQKGLRNHKVTEVQLRPEGQSLAEVMTSHRSMREKKNNELMMTSRTHMLSHTRSHARANSNSWISYGNKNLSRAIVHKSSSWKTNLLCTASTSDHTLLHFPLSLLPGVHRHTKLPTGIKAYINWRGPDAMNPVHTSHWARGSSTAPV